MTEPFLLRNNQHQPAPSRDSLPMKLFLATLIVLGSATPSLSGEYQPGYSKSQTCTRNEYREEYIPGTKKSPGFVNSWTEVIEVPCDTKPSASVISRPMNQQPDLDTNDCSQGSLIGGLLGAGLATSGSRGKDRWWAIPAGAVGGAMLGCQVDGG